MECLVYMQVGYISYTWVGYMNWNMDGWMFLKYGKLKNI